jgi:hypothetical protein
VSIFNKCKHEWEIVVNEYEKSPVQKMNDSGFGFTGDMTQRHIIFGKRIIILKCEKCGKLDKTIERV